MEFTSEKHILLVDDEKMILQVLQEFLKKIGYSCTGISAQTYDLVAFIVSSYTKRGQIQEYANTGYLFISRMHLLKHFPHA